MASPNKKSFLAATLIYIFLSGCFSSVEAQKIEIGAERTTAYFPMLKDKKVGLVGNQTSMVGGTHLLDTLLHSGIEVCRIFCPEHGFRGEAEAGARVGNIKKALPFFNVFSNTQLF